MNTIKNDSGIRINFRPVFQIEPVGDPPEDAAYNLDEVKFDSKNANFTSIIFTFSKNTNTSSNSSIPEDSNPPRIFLLEDNQKKRLRIRITNTLPVKKLKNISFSGSRIDLEEMFQKENQTFMDLKLKMSSFRVEKNFVSIPLTWKLNIHGVPESKKHITPREEATATCITISLVYPNCNNIK